MIKEEGENLFKMSSFEKLELSKSKFNNIDFSNMNYGNNPLNIINMPNQHFINQIPLCKTINLNK